VKTLPRQREEIQFRLRAWHDELELDVSILEAEREIAHFDAAWKPRVRGPQGEARIGGAPAHEPLEPAESQECVPDQKIESKDRDRPDCENAKHPLYARAPRQAAELADAPSGERRPSRAPRQTAELADAASG
jgi:hypothetical protein